MAGLRGIWPRRVTWAVALFFVVSMVGFSALRIDGTSSVGSADELATTDFDRRYVEHPVVTYFHIVAGVGFILLAPLQFSRWLRRRSLKVHRTVGKVAVVLGLVSAVFGVVFGVLFPWGGFAESSSSVLFGGYMVVALTLGYRRAVDRDIFAHRRWMIRAFAVALGVATVRVILSLGEELDLYTFDEAFGLAFWAGFAINAVGVELWLQRWPKTSLANPRPKVELYSSS